MSIRGLMVDPKTNSPNYQHMNCIADSKKNYWWGILEWWDTKKRENKKFVLIATPMSTVCSVFKWIFMICDSYVSVSSWHSIDLCHQSKNIATWGNIDFFP